MKTSITETIVNDKEFISQLKKLNFPLRKHYNDFGDDKRKIDFYIYENKFHIGLYIKHNILNDKQKHYLEHNLNNARYFYDNTHFYYFVSVKLDINAFKNKVMQMIMIYHKTINKDCKNFKSVMEKNSDFFKFYGKYGFQVYRTCNLKDATIELKTSDEKHLYIKMEQKSKKGYFSFSFKHKIKANDKLKKFFKLHSLKTYDNLNSLNSIISDYGIEQHSNVLQVVKDLLPIVNKLEIEQQ